MDKNAVSSPKAVRLRSQSTGAELTRASFRVKKEDVEAPMAPPRVVADSPSMPLACLELLECEREDTGWRLTLQQGEERVVVVRSEEAMKELARQLQIAQLNTSTPAALETQLRAYTQHAAFAAMLAEAIERKPKTPWFVDCRIIEGQNLKSFSSSERVYVSVCLESQPGVRVVTNSAPAEGSRVWNCDGSFVCDNANTDKLHVTLLSKRSNTVIGKFAVALKQVLGGPPGPKVFWYNLRDVYDAVCIECDRPLDSSLTVPFGYTSVGLLHLQIEVSQNHASMAWAKFGVPLRWLPYRVLPGDLLFFSSKKLVTTGTKIATRSRWDHVALVISYKQYRKMYILQSTTSGVEVSEAEAVLKGYWGSSRAIGVRRLMVDRKGVVQGLSEFAEKNVGKSYNFNFIVGRGKRGKDVADADRDKLFCSELVAAAFMHVGLLSTDLSASSFLPATLASSKTMLLSGSQLLPLVKFPVPSPSSQDIVWAREETCLREAYRLSATGRPFEPLSQAAQKLLRSVRKHMSVVVAFPRAARDHTELSLEEGDVILVLEKDPTAWWTGQQQRTGLIGAFPANHVELPEPKKKPRNHHKEKKQSSEEKNKEKRPSADSTSPKQSLSDSERRSAMSSPPALDVLPVAPSTTVSAALGLSLGECSHCKQPFDAMDVPLIISSTPLHEKCLSRYVSQWQDRESVSCFICHIVSHLTVTKCAFCTRPVCAQCGGTDGDESKESKCRVCKWTPPNSGLSARKDAEVMIAVHGHQKRSPHELHFFVGDEVELWDRLDWGWCVGWYAPDKTVGIFPEAVVQPKGNRKWSFRKAAGRKSPGASSSNSMDNLTRMMRHRSTGALSLQTVSSPEANRSPPQVVRSSTLAAPTSTTNTIESPFRTPSPSATVPATPPHTPLKSSRGPAPEVPERPPTMQRRVSVFEMMRQPEDPRDMSASLNRLADDFSGEEDSSNAADDGDEEEEERVHWEEHSGEIDSQEDQEESSTVD